MDTERVVAIIPNKEEPPRFLVGPDGRAPEIARTPGQSAESMLTTLGSRALTSGNHLGANYLRQQARDESYADAWAFETKPVDTDAAADGHMWVLADELPGLDLEK